jgi:hypothetical protein
LLGEHFVKAQFALTAWRDGGHEGISGMLATAFCIRNRVRAGFYNGDWLRVLSHHQDYAATDRTYSLELPDPRNYAFGLLLQEIDGIFAGTREDDITIPPHSMARQTPVVLYYGNLADPNLRPWFLNICRDHENHQRVATVGTLTFFS